MNARNALLRGVGAAFDNGEAIETLADDINLMLDVLIPNPEDRVRAVTRLQRIEALAGHGRATGEARKVASLIAVRTLSADLTVQLGEAGGVRLFNNANDQVADVRADGSVFISGLSMTVDEVARRWDCSAQPAS